MTNKRNHIIAHHLRFRSLMIMVCLFVFAQANSQDLHFSQFYEAPLLRNPALAGLFNGDFRTQVVYRNQWASVTNPYQTGSLNSEYKYHIGKGNDFMTAGLQILWDKAGAVNLRTTHLLPAIVYHKSLNDEKNRYVSLGFMGGVVSRALDRDKVTTSSQFDGFTWNGLLPDGETFGSSYSYFDMNIGMSYNSSLGGNDKNNFFLGAAYHHLNEPRNSFYTELTHIPKLVLSGGLRFTMGDISYMTFYSDYSKQGGFSEFIGGATYSRMFGDYARPDLTLHVGTYLRWQDAVVLTTKLDFAPIAIGFSYDVNVSSLRTASEGRGAFEFSLNYTAFSKRDKSSNYSTRCPRF